MIDSWVYLFSQFTPEALLLEALGISLLLTSYSAFWILRKRRFGSMKETVPSSVIREYLGDLIVDAEELRNQLFGLLSQMDWRKVRGRRFRGVEGDGDGDSAGADSSMDDHVFVGGDPDMPAALAGGAGALISDQTRGGGGAGGGSKRASQAEKMIAQLIAEKDKLAQELEAAKTSGGGAGGGGAEKAGAAASEATGGKGKGGPSFSAEGGGNQKELMDKIKSLEDRLAEYSVIEDDLANLKRLQQENNQLKAELEALKAGGATPAASKEAAPAEPAAKAPPDEDAPAAAEAMPTTPEEPKEAEPEPAAAAAEPAAAQQPADEAPAAPENAAAFEGVVDQVEESLKPATGAQANPEPEKIAEPEPPASTAEAAPATNSGGSKNEADLLSEFERMLNS